MFALMRESTSIIHMGGVQLMWVLPKHLGCKGVRLSASKHLVSKICVFGVPRWRSIPFWKVDVSARLELYKTSPKNDADKSNPILKQWSIPINSESHKILRSDSYIFSHSVSLVSPLRSSTAPCSNCLLRLRWSSVCFGDIDGRWRPPRGSWSCCSLDGGDEQIWDQWDFLGMCHGKIMG